MGGGFVVVLCLLKVVILLDGWHFDSEWGFCSLGGGFVVGLYLLKVVSLLDGRSFDSDRGLRRFAP